ncbi:MAG TPA: alpha/beta hydrolase [Pusillimonas sp.]|nr:alpha/beta hydrolase [Pusillimonas sp.]HUH87781.1 alpha/beta hydrolase [Pusillimonas sp.]
MAATTSSSGVARIQALGRDIDIEYYLISPEKQDADLLVFLHEGLGSASMWKDWPAQVCAAAGCRGLVFSRYGYGASTPRPLDEKWPVQYMHDQAREALPALFNALGMQDEKPVLYGHSDGGSIALLYAAMYPDAVKGIVVAAPHIFVEDISVESIAKARDAFLQTDLPQRLGRYHSNAEATFWAWNDIWLDPRFLEWNIEAYLDKIACPILAVQGVDDEYGTLDQIQGIKRIATHAKLCIIERCRHSPHKDQPEIITNEVANFMRDLV